MIADSPLALTLIAIVAIPLAWSAILAAVRSAAGTQVATERSERIVLALMIAPIFAGLGLIAMAMFAPETAATLPPMVRLTLPQAPVVEQAHAAIAPAFNWVAFLARAVVLLYLVGAAYLVARFIRARLRLRKILKGAADAASAWGEGVGITECDVPPFASGRTRIILPRSLILHLSPDQVAMVVRHERAHLDRRDPALFLALAMIEIALWFNPVIRRQAERCRLAAELACDRLALQSAPAMQKAYAKSLVLALRHSVGDAMYCAPAIPSDTMGDYEMRISEIMRPDGMSSRRPARAPYIAALLLAGPVIFVQTTLAGAAIPDRHAAPIAPLAVTVDQVRTPAPLASSPKPATVAPRARAIWVPGAVATPAQAPAAAAPQAAPTKSPREIVDAAQAGAIWRPSPLFRVCVSRFDRMAAGPGLTEANALLVDAECREATDTAPQKCEAFLTGASRAGSMAVTLVRSNWAEAEKGQYLAALEGAKAGRGACGF